jgi:hypothetical protein
MNVISSYCHIKNNRVCVDGKMCYELDGSMPFPEFAAAAFRNLGVSYPKFFKMDGLCKLGLLASEYLLRSDPAFGAAGPDNTGIVLSNRAASLETDRVHAASISNPDAYFPSPAVFVYTLPNIMIGEISIRHQITGENACFISNEFDAGHISGYVNYLLDQGLIKACLAGWVELDGPVREAFLYLVVPGQGTGKNSNFRLHTSGTLNALRVAMTSD